MTRYVALLRGINMAKSTAVAMWKLKEIFEKLGLKNITTYINSGNVIFDTNIKNTDKLIKQIEKELQKEFGWNIRVLIRNNENIQKLCRQIPKAWKNDLEQKTDIIFLWQDFDKKDTLKDIKTTKNVDRLKYIDGAIVWNIDRKNQNKSGMKKFIGTVIYKNMTARNINTVRKLGELIK